MTDAHNSIATMGQLITLLQLEPRGVDQFQGASEDIGTGRVFGGQVLGQALVAACRTATSPIHSLHAYFLLPGDHHQPIDYLVERVRDGRSFATRRVVAQQKGRTIFTMMASFHAPEAGSFSHQHGMPPAPPPEGLRNETGCPPAGAARSSPPSNTAWWTRWTCCTPCRGLPTSSSGCAPARPCPTIR